MSRQQEEIRITVNYCDDIQQELRENSHNPHWNTYGLKELVDIPDGVTRDQLQEAIK